MLFLLKNLLLNIQNQVIGTYLSNICKKNGKGETFLKYKEVNTNHTIEN